MGKTIFNWIGDDWQRVKNHCRTTVNKAFTDKEPSDDLKEKLLIAEHSPIRLLEFDWSWHGIKSWVATHWVRHKFEKFVSTQRDDRTDDNVSRNDKPQSALVNFDGYANMQSLIDAWKKRLCYQASPETREYAEDFKETLHETHPIESNVLVPQCIYRGGCPEIAGCHYFDGFAKWVFYDKGLPVFLCMSHIQKRYDLYNEYFYMNRKKQQEARNMET